MKKWFYGLIVLLAIYALNRAGKTKKPSTSFLSRLNQTISIIVWVLLLAYAVSFFYWLFTEVF
ncbi:MAG TPA: hypothetical protein ENF17_08785 [Candidatus Aminicenantes bacterium]|nr:hypothetical protein [Candidatus Aminicenantes bacterium]